MTEIHPTAIVSPEARLGDGVFVGPYCVIGERVTLGDRVRLRAHVVVDGWTEIGADTEVSPFVSIGSRPQDLKYAGEESRITIGERNMIRECVSMNTGTIGGGLHTRVGSDCLFMLGAHVSHDCVIGDHVVIANNVALAGHCVVGEYAILGGNSGIHQYCRIGAHAFVGGLAGVVDDVIPYGIVVGNRANLTGLNIIGLKRRGFSREQIVELRKAYRLLFSPEGEFSERIQDVDSMFGNNDAVQLIIKFIRARSERPICQPRSVSHRGSND